MMLPFRLIDHYIVAADQLNGPGASIFIKA